MQTEKIDSRIETIFSHAVALDQSGRLRNTIYLRKRTVFILNSDRTILLKFSLSSSFSPFKNPISFKAADYDSNMFHEKDGKIVFISKSGDMLKKKSCGVPELSPKEVLEIYKKFKKIETNKIEISKNILQLLDENLSHIEISGKDGNFKIIQRNIYDGTIIELSREKGKGFGVSHSDKIDSDFGPLGLRTQDFIALFAFNDSLVFNFPTGSKNGYCTVSGKNFKMKGIIALCLYDELGIITESDNSISKKKKKRKAG